MALDEGAHDREHSFCAEGFWLLLAVNVVFSFTGGGAACWAIQMTVMSDISSKWSVERRTNTFMLLEAAGAAHHQPSLLCTGPVPTALLCPLLVCVVLRGPACPTARTLRCQAFLGSAC